ncbi:spindle assembly abnormal protein 6 homolog [Clytia hemisphaerica]|uniref:Spindle assembly abnormal protein 6 homolog n=1 Tax=Clytia hemisphaerica TaxID=252671 RepID=A0A7M5V961_9CNID|eukprot:TCONS_00070976-protein
MKEDGKSEENLFSKDVNVLYKEFDQRKCTLHISISLTINSSNHRKELYVRLTNPNDLLFLHSMTLGEEDFLNLKKQQGLLVDFAAFPQKFIELLELCINEQTNNVPRFLLNLTTNSSLNNSSTFDVVETNPFKHLVHLSLKFLPGNDEEIKRYLASCLKTLQEENTTVRQNLSSTENELSNRLSCTQQLLNEKTKELDQLRGESEQRINNATSSLQRDLNEAQLKFEQCQRRNEEQFENERKNNDSRYNKMMSDLEQKLRTTQASNKELVDQKYRFEGLIRDLKSRLQNLEEEKEVTNKDLSKLRRQNTNLDTDRHERDKTLNHLRTRVAVLEQELKDKQQVILRTNELMENSSENKRRMEFDLEAKQNTIMKLEQTIKSVSAEVIKGNEIIQKLQTEMRSLKQRVKMMNIVTTKQEKLIEEKDILLKENEEKISSLKQLEDQHQEEAKKLKQSMEELSLKLNESQETLKNNENVISWLNKQLNEQTLQQPHKTFSTTSNISTNQNSRIQYQPMNNNLGNTKDFTKTNTSRPVGGGTNFQRNTATQQVPSYRPILKKSHFDVPHGISPIVPMTTNNQSNARKPLRQQHQMSTPLLQSQNNSNPVLENKYLSKPPQTISGEEENQDPSLQRKSKPFVLASAYFNENTAQ